MTDESQPAPGDAAALQREVERLRTQLALSEDEAGRFRRAAYALLCERVPYTPPTDEELHDLLHGPRGRPIRDILDREGAE
ncbi:MAG: hypothetical protein FJ304_21670 [Planctomycetes bacterium]|nr:hypothetical protein [Planctomycetota bacterium]